MDYIATFYTHLGAINFYSVLQDMGQDSAIVAAPRELSLSCGSAVRFEGPFDRAWADEDTEAVYHIENGNYIRIFYQD